MSSEPSLNESTKTKSMMMIVGDVSADRHASLLVDKLMETSPELKFWGCGGDEMKAKGVELLYHLEDFSAVGIVENIKFLPIMNKMADHLLNCIKERDPDLLLMVDFGAFNLWISKKIRKKYPNLPIVYFISPQVWASRPWRLNTIKKNTSKMLVIFPFEEALYREKGISSRFVGHPLVEQLPKENEIISKEEFFKDLGLNLDKELVSIFPGSRKQEILGHTPVIIQAMAELIKRRPGIQFIVSMVNEKLKGLIEGAIAKSSLKDEIGKSIFLVGPENNYPAMAHADLVWAKSGTTTLEVALFAKPMLIFYRGNWISYFIVLLFKTIKNVGWPNLLAGKLLVPELLQLDCCARQFVRYTGDLLDVPGLRKEIQKELLSVRDQLGKGNYVTNCADEIQKHLSIGAKSTGN